MADDIEQFSNPIAPANAPKAVQKKDNHPLSNDDFRKLMMTPRAGTVPSSVRGGSSSSSSKGKFKKPDPKDEEEAQEKTKKKKFFQALKKQEDDVLAELSSRYRDRARERRDGANPDYKKDEHAAVIPAYSAVSHDAKAVDTAEQRKKLIHESKYLGGDMEHTHLVKGLDFALLQKVKAEIAIKELEDPSNKDESETIEVKDELDDLLPDISDQDDTWEIKSLLAKNVVSLINRKLPEKNDLFLPSRMAYVVDLEGECADEIPTTVIRSKADCPNWDSISTLSTNDIVINKLTQILSYLRTGGKKKNKKDKDRQQSNDTVTVKLEKAVDLDGGIYGEDIGDYQPDFSRKKEDKSDRRQASKRNKNYFDGPSASSSREENISVSLKSLRSEIARSINKIDASIPEETIKGRSKLSTLDVMDSYAECYPGAPENDDAVIDSDDEVDYTKMDTGSKKGNINRWDFDTAEEYGDFMNNKEALPKAAFQYGLKMSDGRKTRGKPKNDKTKLDRDFNKINALIAKRKAEVPDGGGQPSFQTPRRVDSKRQKH
ncbi:Protein Red [Halotydeus destructor]|nr:Protein Red [Halotydeus destructor]